jgi:hypothetical protein
MNKKLKYSELAKALDVNPGVVGMAVKRNHLRPVLNDKGKTVIDLDCAYTIQWLEKQKELGKIFDINRLFDKKGTKQVEKQPTNIGKNVSKSNGKATIQDNDQSALDKLLTDVKEVELKIKKANLEKTLKAIKLDQLKIEKQEGRLIPFDAVQNFFLFVVETFSKTFSQESKSIANIMVNRLGGERKHLIEIQKELSIKLEELKEQSIKEALAGLDNIVDEYKEVRSRGEKK